MLKTQALFHGSQSEVMPKMNEITDNGQRSSNVSRPSRNTSSSSIVMVVVAGCAYDLLQRSSFSANK